MSFYKVAAVTCTQRVEWADQFADYSEAKLFFCDVCALCDQLSLNAICLLEQNALVLEAYRRAGQSKMPAFNAEVIDIGEAILGGKGFSAAGNLTDVAERRGIQRLNSPVPFSPGPDVVIDVEVARELVFSQPPPTLVERIYNLVIRLSCTRPAAAGSTGCQ